MSMLDRIKELEAENELLYEKLMQEKRQNLQIKLYAAHPSAKCFDIAVCGDLVPTTASTTEKCYDFNIIRLRINFKPLVNFGMVVTFNKDELFGKPDISCVVKQRVKELCEMYVREHMLPEFTKALTTTFVDEMVEECLSNYVCNGGTL